MILPDTMRKKGIRISKGKTTPPARKSEFVSAESDWLGKYTVTVGDKHGLNLEGHDVFYPDRK
jgi:hypothetical protein